MKVSELLRKLVDVIAAAEGTEETGQLTQPNKAELTPVDADHTDHSEGNVMVPPLQAKLEILKKSVGMDNVYGNDQEDELNDIKKNAGLTPAQQDASDDEPLDV